MGRCSGLGRPEGEKADRVGGALSGDGGSGMFLKKTEGSPEALRRSVEAQEPPTHPVGDPVEQCLILVMRSQSEGVREEDVYGVRFIEWLGREGSNEKCMRKR